MGRGRGEPVGGELPRGISEVNALERVGLPVRRSPGTATASRDASLEPPATNPSPVTWQDVYLLRMDGFGRMKWTVALVAGALVLPLVNACQTQAASLTSIVADLAGSAGSDIVASIYVERVPDKGLAVTASFIKDDGTAVQYAKRPSDKGSNRLGSPVPSIPLAGVPTKKLDLAGLEQRMHEIPNCQDPRGEVFVFGTHVAENVRCGHDGAPTGRLDGVGVPVIAAGNVKAAASRLRDDAALMGAKQVGRVAIGTTGHEVWTQVQVVDPTPPASNGNTCAVFMTRSGGSLYPRCEQVLTRFPVSAVDPAALVKIWETEGAPTSDWLADLVGENDPYWRTRQGKDWHYYRLDGTRR